VLAVCSEGNLADGKPWHSTLRDGREAGWTIVAERAGVDHPSPRTRYTIELQAPAGGQVTLQHDVLIGVERSETTMLVTYGAATLRFTGFAGATGPDYTVTQNGGPLGRIAWAGRVGFVTADPAGGSARARRPPAARRAPAADSPRPHDRRDRAAARTAGRVAALPLPVRTDAQVGGRAAARAPGVRFRPVPEPPLP
jgi:hypothetical protein